MCMTDSLLQEVPKEERLRGGAESGKREERKHRQGTFECDTAGTKKHGKKVNTRSEYIIR